MDVDKGRGSLQRTRKLVASTRVTLAEQALIQAAAIEEGTNVATMIRNVVLPYARRRLAEPVEGCEMVGSPSISSRCTRDGF